MRRAVILLPLLLVLLGSAPCARAGDADPTVDQLARMILRGNDAEHALVAAWLEDADRAALRAVFARLRALGAASAPEPSMMDFQSLLEVSTLLEKNSAKSAATCCGLLLLLLPWGVGCGSVCSGKMRHATEAWGVY